MKTKSITRFISGHERQQLREEVTLLNQDIDHMMSRRRGY